MDAETLQQAYSVKSRAAHPDHGGSETSAAALNEAYQTLRKPHKRLKHLVDLLAPDEAKAWSAVPLDEEMMGLFMTLGSALESSSRHLEKKAKMTSALAKAVLAGEEMQHRERLENIGHSIATLSAQMERGLPSLDEAMARSEEGVWTKLAAMQARFAYLSKWQTEVRERLLALM